ncbi:MAG TPA: class I SAM-dependent methyltransferase [Candidatus Pacearchaeota archaeon]|nr:class I SAM-dependent methyltransferase [Candidatus Pacearchaeota archaeon]
MNKKEEIIKEYQQEDFVEDFDKTRSESIFLQEKHRFETKLIQKAIKSIKKKEVQVLDVACGTGRLLTEIIKSPRVIYTGLDTSPAMIKKLKEKNKSNRVKLVLADAAKMPFPNETFDVTFTYHLLWHIPLEDQNKIIKEMIRVTKKGGLIVFDSLNKNFLLEKVRKLFGLKTDLEMYRVNYQKIKMMIYPLNFKTDKLLDAPIKNKILFRILNILNKFNKFLPSSLFHMIFFTIKK